MLENAELSTDENPDAIKMGGPIDSGSGDARPVESDAPIVGVDVSAAQATLGGIEPIDPDTLGAGAASSYAGFDPSIHAINPDGTPKFTAKGEYAKKRGRKPGSFSPPRIEGAQPAQTVVNPSAPTGATSTISPELSSGDIAKIYAGLFFTCGYAVFGDEWRPDDAQEANMVTAAFKGYVEASGIKPPPPGVALAMALGMYSVRRMDRPVTKSKLQKLREKLALAVAWVKVKLHGG